MAGAMKSRVRNGKYVFEYDVGQWTFGNVAVYKDRESSTLRTCRIVPKNLLRNPADALNRFRQLQGLKHPHVASMVEVIEEPGNLFIVSEFYAGGAIDDWVAEVESMGHNTGIDEATCCGYTRQALLALVHCERQGVVHGDLRPSSLLLTTKNSDAAVKVDGAGLTSVLDPDRSQRRRHGGPYTAPEVMDGSAPFGSGAPDVWSLGAIAHALLTGKPPNQGGGGVFSGLFSARDDEWAERSDLSRDFVDTLLRPIGERPTAVQALQHPWIKALMPSGPGASPIQDVPSKTLCYMLAVLLVPTLVPLGDFEKLHWSFLQADTDGDGLVPQAVAHRLLQTRTLTKDVAEAAIEMADIGGTGVVDMCAVAVADVIGREFLSHGPAPASEISQHLMKRFFTIYSDTNSSTVTSGQIRNRLRTATRREMERCCGVSYDQVLVSFPDDCPLSAQILAASFINCGGQGTPIGGSLQKAPDELSQFIFGLDGLENVIGGIFQACGLSRLPMRRIEVAECL